MTDERILIGVFLCTDSVGNIILGLCTEYSDDFERILGLVMVPKRFIVSIEVDMAGQQPNTSQNSIPKIEDLNNDVI